MQAFNALFLQICLALNSYILQYREAFYKKVYIAISMGDWYNTKRNIPLEEQNRKAL